MALPDKNMNARRVAAFAVHLFTASGVVVAMLALNAAIERDFPLCFAWLGAALFIDGIDGTLARAAGVREIASAIDGVVLDLVVDFLTYVVTPVVAIWRSDLMPAPLAEYVPFAPGPGYRWVPGYWTWAGSWVWVSGQWTPYVFFYARPYPRPFFHHW